MTPFQWSFPLNLPPQFFGIFPAGELVDGDTDTPWGGEIEQKLLLPPPIGEWPENPQAWCVLSVCVCARIPNPKAWTHIHVHVSVCLRPRVLQV